jgi:hypothetical protein
LRVKWKYLAVLCLLFVATLVQGPAANAASPYDNAVHSTSTLTLTNESSSTPIDITTKWKAAVGDGCSGFTSSLSEAMASSSGAWAATQIHAVAPSMYADGSLDAVYVAWTSNKSTHPLQWSYNTTVQYVSASAENVARLYQDRSGNVQCVNISWIGSVAISSDHLTTDAKYEITHLFSTFDPDYPSGYSGSSLQTADPNATFYTGTVDCGGLEVQGVRVNQEGNGGAAVWSYASAGRANWNYNFYNKEYTLTVGCGETAASVEWMTLNYSAGSVYPSTGTDWVCDTSWHYCQLS